MRAVAVGVLAPVVCLGLGCPTPGEREAALEQELAACRAGEPAGLPSIEALTELLTRAGETPVEAAGLVRVPRGGEDDPWAITVQVFPDKQVVYLATTPLVRLSDAAGDAGVVLLLTQLAALNYDTMEGKFQLNPATGDVLVSIELEADEGVGAASLKAALDTLTEVATEGRPKLRAAAAGASL